MKLTHTSADTLADGAGILSNLAQVFLAGFLMSVYTPLTLKEVQVFAAPYGLEVVELIPDSRGILIMPLFFALRQSKPVRADHFSKN